MEPPKLPEVQADIQLVGIQNLSGRGHQHVRAFGYRELDPEKKLVELALELPDAIDVIRCARTNHAFPILTVPEKTLVSILSTKGIDVIHINAVGDEKEDDAT